ncbi:MAG: hypothetical protein MJ056_04465 [Akkermansia sp.]|nr:hypothetical protein [Akkermansia sp.]
MKLRINAKLRAALIAAISTVGFTLTQAQAATQYSTPTYGGAEYVWHGDHWEYPEGTTVNEIARVNNKGGVMVIEDAGTVSNPVGVKDTSDYGGVKVTGATDFTTNLGGWAGSIYVGEGSALSANYGVDLKTTEQGNAATVYVDGTLTITGRSNLSMNDGNGSHNWYIGEEGFINLSGITGVSKGSRAWNFQLSVDPGEQFDLTGYTNRTLGGQLTKKFMSTGADLYGQVASFAVFCDGVEMDSSKYTINHDASGMSVTYDAATAIKKMSLTWAGGEAAWEVKGTNWTDAAGTTTSFASGDDVTFTGSGNKAIVNGAIEAGAITVNGGTTIDTTADGASLTANSLTIGAGGSLTLAGTAAIGGAVSVADANALVIGEGSMLKVAGETAKSLIQGTQVANGGTVEVAGGMSFNSSATSKMGGTLAIAAGQTLTLGTNKDNQVYDLTSLDALVLGKGANINTKAKTVTIKNLTVNGTTINQQDTLDANTVGLDLKGTTTLAGDLTITGDWKYKMNIDALAGSGSLTLTGGQQEHRAVIGSADINSITVTNKMNETWLDGAVKLSGTLALNGGTTYAGENGSLTVGGLTGSNALKLANGITFTGTGNYTYSGTLTSTGGQIVKQGTGSQTIGGTSLFRTIDVQAGTLVLNGSYAIDSITDGDVTENYIGVDGQQHEEGGFYLQSGTKTVYAVAESGANLDLSHAVFTYGGSDVTAQVVKGSFTIPGGEPNYSVLYVNKDTVDYTAHAQYAQEKGATITSVVVKDGATVDLGENSTIANLQYAATGITAGIAGKGSITAFTGTGALDLKEGAVLTLADQTLGSNQTLVTSGEGTLSMQNLKVNGGGAVATIGSNATLHQITMGSGTVNLNGDITMERFVLSLENSASTMNIGKGATVHVKGTTLSVHNNEASFMVSNWNQVNTLNIEGTLIAEAGISSRDGKANLNVKDGGTLELHQGLLYMKNTAQYTNINVESGGTLLTAGNANDQAGAGLHVNLNNGSTLKGYYAEGVDTAAIAQTLTLAGTVTIDAGEAGKTLQINSDIDDEGVAIVKKGAGELVLNGGGNYLYNAINVQEGTLALNGGFELSGIQHEEGTVQYYKDDKEGTPATENGFAKYVGEVQLISGNYGSVSVGEDAVLLLDGYSVTYDEATGKAVSSEINLDTYFINKNSETVSSIVAVAPDADVTLADGAKLVADTNYSGAISVTSGKGYVEIGKDATVQNTTAAIELSGSGTYVLASGASNLGTVTLGDSWTGAVKVTKNDLANLNLNTFGKAGSVVEIDGWSKHLNNTDAAVPYTYDPKLRLGTNGLTIADGYSGRTYIFAGGVEGAGNFMYNIATTASNQIYAFTGDVSKWTGAYQSLKAEKTSTLQFYGSATAMGAAIEQTQGTINIEVGNGTDVFATVFNNAVTATQLTILDKASATLKGESTIGTLAGPGSLAVDAGEHTVTINGITGLSNTITLTSGTLSLNGTVNISGDMPIAGSITYTDGDNGFRHVEGKLQVVSVAADATLTEGTVSYIYGGAEIATSLDNGAIALTPTTTYDTYYVNKGAASMTHAIEGAAAQGETLAAVVLADGTTLTADGGSTGLVVANDASATGDTTAATTISSLTGPGADKTLTLGGTAQLTIQNPNAFAGTVNVQSGANVYLDGTTTAATLAKIVNAGTLSVAVGNGTQIAMTSSAGGTLAVRSGQVDYRSTLGGQVLELGNATLLFGNAGDDTTHTYAGDIVVAGSANVTTYGTSQHPTATISGSVTGDGTLTRVNDGNQTLAFTGTVNLGGYTNNDGNDGNLTDFQGATNIGTLTIGNANAKTKFSHEDTTIGIIAMNTNATVEIAGNTSVGAVSGSKDLTLNVTNDATATLTGTSSFNKLVSTGKVVVDKDAVVTLSNNLTPNSGTVEVNGTVSANHEVDLSYNGASKGILKVGSTGVVSTKDGMWMAKSAAVQLAEGGTFNIAGLQIIGENGGASLTTTADNGQYGTNNAAFIITNAAVTGTTNINPGNQPVTTTLTTGAYPMPPNNAAPTYHAVYASTGGTLVVNADIDLAGVLHSSGAITVNEEKSLTLTEGSSLFQTVTNGGTVSLTGITLGGGFSEQTDGSAYYDIDGNVTTEDQNHYEGTATTYVQVVDGGTSTGTGIQWKDKSYNLSENTGRIIVGQGSVKYDTFYVTTEMDSSALIHSGNYDQLNTIVVTDWAVLTLDEAVTGKTIVVRGGGFITGSQMTPESVSMAAGASSILDAEVATEGGVTFNDAVATVITNTNEEGSAVQYSTSQKALEVAADTMTMTADTDVTVSNQLDIDEVVNTTGHVLTLDNAVDLELKSMTIGEGSTVAVYTDETAAAEGTVTITESLTAGGGKLYANLTLEGHEGEQLLYWDLNGAGENALTLGSVLTLDTQSGLIQLDNETMQAIAALGDRGEYLELVLNGGEPGTLGYDGDAWFDGVFSRTYTNAQGVETSLAGDYNVQLLENGNFGIVKFSNVPEPTTGTLSLLALAALAARRRKH